MSTDIERLRALAAAATPGPYRYTEDDGHDGPSECDDLIVQANTGAAWENLLTMDWSDWPPRVAGFTRAQGKATAKLFAACDPATIAALCDEIAALRAVNTKLRAAGRPLATIAFNVCQRRSPCELNERERLILDQARKDWDAALAATQLEAQP